MIPDWATKLPWDVIRAKALEHGLSPEMIAATVQTESSGNPFAIRCEASKIMNSDGRIFLISNWKYFLEPDTFAGNLGCSRGTEWAGQMQSWGLMQVMGSVAREHGFKGWFPELCQIELGIEYGCRHLKQKAQRYGEDPPTLYSAYNAGSPVKTLGGMFENQKHVDNFMRIYRELLP